MRFPSYLPFALFALLQPVVAWADLLKTSENTFSVSWTPTPELTMVFRGGPSEIGPHPDRPDQMVWKSPTIVSGKGSPAGEGRKLVIKQTRDWVEDHRDGTIDFTRTVSASGTSAELVDEWKCRTTKEAFVTNSFSVKLLDHPDLEVKLLGTKGAKLAEPKADVFIRSGTWPIVGGEPIGDGVEYRNLAGGTLRITASKPLFIEFSLDDQGDFSVRFRERDLVELKTGKVSFKLDWKKM